MQVAKLIYNMMHKSFNNQSLSSGDDRFVRRGYNSFDIAMRIGYHLPLPVKRILRLRFEYFLLSFPFLYRTFVINYESGLSDYFKRLTEVLEETRSISGDIIECGANTCGTSCFIGSFLQKGRISKKVLALDTFGQGFNREEFFNERKAGLTSAHTSAFTFTSFEYVKRKIQVLGIVDYVVPVKGWFSETLPTLCGPFSLALIDCDMEKSTIECIEYIWPRLTNGGCMLIDDYQSQEYRGVKKAVDGFLERRSGEVSRVRVSDLFEIWKFGGK